MKILYVATISDTINAFLIPHIEMLVSQGHQVDVACHVYQELDDKLKKMGCAIFDIPFDRSPIKIQNYKAYKILKEVISSQRYDIVHTHTPVASACVRLACRKMENVKVIYTAHGFHFFKGAPLINWLTYYPVERWLARYTDVLITINREDYDRANRLFNAGHISYIPGVGIDIQKYDEIKIDRTEKRRELGVPEDAFLILSVGELNKNKNHETVIRAIEKLKDTNVYYAICGKGPLEKYLKKLSENLGVVSKVIFLGYRKDMPEIYKCSDLFVFPSFREGLPVSLMEALASGLPVVCSDIRGNKDLVVDESLGYKLKPDDDHGYASIIRTFINDSKKRRVNPNVMNRFSIETVLGVLKEIYTGTPKL